MNTSHQETRPVILWVVVAVIAVHFIEEYAMNFPGWTRRFFAMPLTFEDFHLVNACVALYAVACAAVGWRLPALSLSSAGLVGLNGVFHGGAFVAGAGYSPGAITGLFLFIPVALAAFLTARRAGLLATRTLMISIAIAVLWHAFLGAIFYLKYFAPPYP